MIKMVKVSESSDGSVYDCTVKGERVRVSCRAQWRNAPSLGGFQDKTWTAISLDRKREDAPPWECVREGDVLHKPARVLAMSSTFAGLKRKLTKLEAA